MTDPWFANINDMLEELSKIEHKMMKLKSTKDMLNGYIAYMEKSCPEDVKKEIPKPKNPKEPSKDDFKQTCDSLLKQLKEARLKIDELTQENKDLNNAISSLEDTNRILLTTIDILNNKLEDIEEYLYINDLDNDVDYEEDEAENKEKQQKQDN